MCLRPRGEGEKPLLKTEKKIQELQEDLSLTTLNGENLKFSWILDTPSKGQPQAMLHGHGNIEMDTIRGHVANS